MRRQNSRKPSSHPGSALKKSIVLVGLMGAGKSSIGRLVASRLKLEFIDADTEIESAADSSIEEIFESHGEAVFRSGERRVIERLLAGPVRIIATGGGAFIDNETRKQITTSAHSIWLKADLETLLKRVARRGGRPLLKNKDPRTVMATLMAERDPVYAKANITVETSENPPAEIADRVIQALERYLGVGPLAPARKPGKSRGQAGGNRGRGKGAANTADKAAKKTNRSGPTRGTRRRRQSGSDAASRQGDQRPGQWPPK